MQNRSLGVQASNREEVTGVHERATNVATMPVSGASLEANRPGYPADRLLGRTIGKRYVLEKRIARGAMGCVYQARQDPLDRPVAIKVLDPKGATEDAETFQARFAREASTLARLQHPNSVRVYDFGEWRNHTYLVMEYVDGYSLRRLQAGGPVPATRLLHIATQICDALQEAHALGLIHRDLKPANVLLTRHAGALDVVKVVDFGLAKEFHGSDDLTMAGQVLGTPMYMAPEQIRDEAVDQRTDIYALGVLMYRALTGKTPFEKGKAMKVLMAHLKQAPPSFAEANPAVDVPPALEWVVQTCLAKKPEHRFANVVELKKALEAVKLAYEEPSMWDLDLALHEGHTVLPEDLCETTGASMKLRKVAPERRGDRAPSAVRPETGTQLLDRLPARTLGLLFALVSMSSVLAGAALERWLP